ncbi:hypothetical protein AAG906_019676 [Vitis piasezkii]
MSLREEADVGLRESKSYEITTEVVGESLKGIIGVFMQGHVKSWEDGGRRYKLEIRANEAGSVSGRKRCIGRVGLVGRKLRFLGVASWEKPKGTAAFYGKGCTNGESVRKDKNPIGRCGFN